MEMNESAIEGLSLGVRQRVYGINTSHITALALLRRHRDQIERVLGKEFAPMLAVPLIAAGIVRELGDNYEDKAWEYAQTMRTVTSALDGTKPLAANDLLERVKEKRDEPAVTVWNWTAIEAFLEVAKVYGAIQELHEMPCKAHVIWSDKGGSVLREEVTDSKVTVVGDTFWKGELFG